MKERRREQNYDLRDKELQKLKNRLDASIPFILHVASLAYDIDDHKIKGHLEVGFDSNGKPDGTLTFRSDVPGGHVKLKTKINGIEKIQKYEALSKMQIRIIHKAVLGLREEFPLDIMPNTKEEGHRDNYVGYLTYHIRFP